MDNSGLIVNLAFALAVAAIGGFLAARLGQSVILGYILAGIAIGPYTPGFVGDAATVGVLADIGVVFLMFTIGVRVSFDDLRRVGGVAVLGGSAQVALIILIGYFVGTSLGWQPLEAVFFGAVLSNSSSTVLTKILGERGEADSVYGHISLAWSTVQDLSTVVLVIVLSSFAGGTETLLADSLWAAGRAVLFLGVLALLGSRVFPWLFEHIAALRSREVFILAVVGVALGTAYLATLFGLSLALGAFLAGLVLNESDLTHQILGELSPIRDIFASLFFVSIGMLVDPFYLVANIPLVLVALGLVVIAKGFLSTAITALFRYPVGTSLLVGVTLAQSAEFSFILARLGADLGAVRESTFGLMLISAAASIVLSPFMHRLAHPAAEWLESRVPESELASHQVMEDPKTRPRGHVVICGYGRVGRVVGSALRRRSFQFIVVEQDRDMVRKLRQQGIVALMGDAGNEAILSRTSLESARLLVVAIPDALAARRAVDFARRVNPRLDVIARTHSATERESLYRRGATSVVLGELELAIEMARYTLRRFGVSILETQTVLQSLRQNPDMEEDRDYS